MNATLGRLASLKVRDVMSHNLVEVSQHTQMADAACQLFKAQISGAPVIDEQGRCVGILSAGDFIRREAALKREDDACRQDVAWELAAGDPHQPLRAETSNPDSVDANMSSGVQSISPEASLLAAAEQMCKAHIHRLPVLDHRGRPQGMISSLDIVAALLGVVDEATTGGAQDR